MGSTTQQAFVIIREQKGSGIQFPSLMHVKGLIQDSTVDKRPGPVLTARYVLRALLC